MRLFLDTSVLLAACASERGASREILRLSAVNQWVLISTPYVVSEVLHNVSRISESAALNWMTLRKPLQMRQDVLTIDRIVVFGPAKDRPILFGACAFADVLLTLDRNDFGGFIGKSFYGLRVRTPGGFLEEERAAGLLKILS